MAMQSGTQILARAPPSARAGHGRGARGRGGTARRSARGSRSPPASARRPPRSGRCRAGRRRPSRPSPSSAPLQGSSTQIAPSAAGSIPRGVAGGKLPGASTTASAASRCPSASRTAPSATSTASPRTTGISGLGQQFGQIVAIDHARRDNPPRSPPQRSAYQRLKWPGSSAKALIRRAGTFSRCSGRFVP